MTVFFQNSSMTSFDVCVQKCLLDQVKGDQSTSPHPSLSLLTRLLTVGDACGCETRPPSHASLPFVSEQGLRVLSSSQCTSTQRENNPGNTHMYVLIARKSIRLEGRIQWLFDKKSIKLWIKVFHAPTKLVKLRSIVKRSSKWTTRRDRTSIKMQQQKLKERALYRTGLGGPITPLFFGGGFAFIVPTNWRLYCI